MTGVEYLTTQALAEFSDGRSQPQLLSLLLPVHGWRSSEIDKALRPRRKLPAA